MTGPARFRSQHPHGPSGNECTQRVLKIVNKIAIVLAEPYDHRVHDLLRVFIFEVRVDHIFDRIANIEVNIVVVAELLNDLTILKFKHLGKS